MSKHKQNVANTSTVDRVCGIFGQSASDLDRIQKALELMNHRGPDAVNSLAIDNVQLGICRLAIVNQSQMFQPYQAKDKSVMLVFNGELYNYDKLIDKHSLSKYLKNMDDGFFLIELFKLIGIEMFRELDGMFAIALYDSRSQKIFLARDRVGIKPLYYRIDSCGEIRFSSEIEPLAQGELETTKKDKSKLIEYFLVGHISAPQTYHDEIMSLCPGDVLEYNLRTKKLSLIFNLNKTESVACNADKDISFSEYVNKLETLIFESVNSVLSHGECNDLFFSGGLDSSLIAALIRVNNKSIRLHKLEFLDSGDGKNQESLIAAKTAAKLGYDLIQYDLTKEEFFSKLPEVYSAFGQPFAGVPSSYFLSKHVSKYGKTAITGDGADELFGSYRFSREISQHLACMSPDDRTRENLSNLFFNTKVKANLSSLLKITKQKHRSVLQDYCFSLSTRYFDSASSAPEISSDSDLLNLALQYDANILLGNQVLLFSDHLGMRNSLEVRPVFLSNNIQEFAKHLPSNFKMGREYETKAILRVLARKYLPEENINQVKEGFQSPIKYWLGSQEFMSRLRASNWQETLCSIPFLDLSKIEQLIDGFMSGDMKEFFLVYKVWLIHEWIMANS